MQTTLSFEGTTPADLAETLSTVPKLLESELADAATDIAQRIEAEATENAPVGTTGNLQSSIRGLVEAVGATLVRIRVGSTADYAAAVEKGTEPHFPPPSALREWARSVLGDADLAFPVARSIAESGTEAQPFLEPAFEDNITFVVDRIDQAVRGALSDAGLG